MVPKDSSVFGLRESFEYMKEHNISAGQFFTSAANTSLNPKHPRIIFSRPTFFRKHKHYMKTNVLPTIDDQGISVRRPQYVADVNLKDLNVETNNTIGLAEKSYRLVDTVMQVKDKTDI